MSKVYELIKENLGMGQDSLEVLQAKAQRIAVLSSLIVEILPEGKKCSMTSPQVADAALVMRTVHPENEGMYKGTEPFDPEKNKRRGEYSLKVAKEKGIELTPEQQSVVRGNSGLIEEGIIKLAETVVALQYDRIQRGTKKVAMRDATKIIEEMLGDSRIDRDLLETLNVGNKLKNIIELEMRGTLRENCRAGKPKADKADKDDR